MYDRVTSNKYNIIQNRIDAEDKNPDVYGKGGLSQQDSADYEVSEYYDFDEWKIK